MKTNTSPLIPQNADDVIENHKTLQRCRTVLDADKLDGQITLEDGELCNITADFDQEERLWVDVYHASWHRQVLLQRNLDPEDARDFIGLFAVAGRQYEVGVIRQASRPLELILFLRPLHLHSTPGGTTLEVLK
jgi:hypothetical protein